MSSRLNRRRFLQTSAAAGAGYWLTANAVSATLAGQQPNDKVRLAGIGIGGKGGGDINQAGSLGQVVALCDIDEGKLNGAAERFSGVKKFTDYRKMFDAIAKEIDAVTVGTPDHTHAPISVMAMKLGKHVYCQKPLTHTVQEARIMRETAKKAGVCAQMGNQGSAANNLRRAVEVVQAGVLGPIREAHVWTDRPARYWKQAPDLMARPAEAPAPSGVHWDEFLGPAPERPYARGYHPFAWRGWWDFGTGALGDMACHTANLPYRALKLAYPTSVVADATHVNPETYPSSAKVTFQFPAREGMEPVTFTWYEGARDGKKLTPPEDLVKRVVPGGQLATGGSILVGAKGLLYSPGASDGNVTVRWIGEGVEEAAQNVPTRLPRNNRGDSGMKAEWVQAMKENKPEIAYSNFDYAALLTETILLGNVAIRLTGQKLEWDGPNLTFTNNRGANQYLHYEYRKGWTL
jgi:predicted dehydrogenase